ncbi:acyl carrier protein 1, chloroplastic-like isoform X2 [Bidens hawaiensis]|uniref:acyl carrier protein 1, chloroplastic-like isoform X2 n=1 Tax=Bidens hawaiensis TaxID=980011 RepID=UPI00404A2E3E
MASIAGSFTFMPCCKLKQSCNFNAVKLVINRRSFPSLKLCSARVSCKATSDTLNRVCKIVGQQLGIPDGYPVTGETKFAVLGADSLFTVEFVMDLEKEFGIRIEEVSSRSITTVQDAADFIEELIAM